MITSKKIYPKTLILRFKKQNKNLIKLLDENNIGFILLPLMSIKALESEKIIKSINNISSTDIFIFVSQNAVETSYKYLSFNNSKIIAIGPTTKSKIEKSGAKVNFCPKDNFTSENLLNSGFLKNVKNNNITIVRGDTGRNKLRRELQIRGANVKNLVTYKKIINKLTSDEVNQLKYLIENKKLEYIVVMSTELVANFIMILNSNNIKTEKLPIFIVPSHRISEYIRENIQDSKCIVTDDPRDEAIVNTLIEYL